MLFSSLTFLYGFLPVTVALYFVAPRRFKNAVLLIASLVFYGWGEPKYLLLMAVSILLAYIFGLLLEKKHSRVFLWAAVILNLALLGYFKYAGFFLSNFSAVTGISVPALSIALPVGISFYTFQALSYVIDVYRGDVPAQRNFVKLAAYIAMFPQLVAGPIVRYSRIETELEGRTHSVAGAASGLRRFVLGLGKKVLLANSLGALCAAFQVSRELSVLYFWLYAVGFTLQIYFDFSGYSDMAIGLGKILGFSFPENFDYPYVSRSITEFWRRWHISLGTWFRDYVYIPLGGGRVSSPRRILNILVVWLLTGLWHGASWNFVLWGLYFAVLLAIEKLWLLKRLERARVWNRIYVLLAVVLSFVLFNANGLHEAAAQLGAMFGAGAYPLVSAEALYYLRSYASLLIISAIAATPLPKKLFDALRAKKAREKCLNALEPPFIAAVLLVSTAYLVDGSFNPFLYFRF